MKMFINPKSAKKNKNVVEFNAIALRKAKIVCNFGLSECIGLKQFRSKLDGLLLVTLSGVYVGHH